jgi:hypothetical protein
MMHGIKLSQFLESGVPKSVKCFRRSKIDPSRRSNFDPLFKLTNLLVYKAHVSLPSPKTLSVHIQDHCVMGNPI